MVTLAAAPAAASAPAFAAAATAGASPRAAGQPIAVEARNVWKLFGPRAAEAMAAMQSGALGKRAVMERYGCVVGVADASFSVPRGSIFCIMGLSGSGKSTLVRHINGLIQPTSGVIAIDGQDVTGLRGPALRDLRAHKVAMVFQNFALLPHRTVIENVAFGLELRDEPPGLRLERAQAMLDLVHLSDWGRRLPGELSGGMQQRVGLARALAGDPDILLMDEPFSALDPLIRRELQDQFLELSAAMQKTTIFITHDLDEALRIGDRIAIMRDGAIVQTGSPAEILARPADDYVASFTRGVSRLKVLTLGDLMSPPGEAPLPGPSLLPDQPLSEAALLLLDRTAPIPIRDAEGRLCGQIGRESLLRLVATEAEPHSAAPFDRRPAAAPVIPAEREARQRPLPPKLSPLALLLGPIAAAGRQWWSACWLAAFTETLALVLLLQAAGTGTVLIGLALLLGSRMGLGWVMGRADRRGALRGEPLWRPDRRAMLAALALLLPVLGLSLWRFVAPSPPHWLTEVPRPTRWAVDTAGALDQAVAVLKANLREVFDQITFGLRATLNFIEGLFVESPWPVVAMVILAVAWQTAGWRVALFALGCLAYLGLLGFWEKSMETLALVTTSVVLCVLIGVPLGVAAAKSRRFHRLAEPVMDVMQTLPTFVYLIPAIAFFSIGKPPAVIATVIFALPPVMRLTALGISGVPLMVREAGLAFAATPLQMLTKIELPLAVPSIRLGINQAIMMSLSMVVVAAMIGAEGLGLDVYRALQMLKTGQGILAGFAIVLCAMLLDRIVRGRRPQDSRPDAEG